MPTTTPRTMTARYRGTCITCAASIIPGDEIVYAGRGLTYHAGPCAEERDPDAVPSSRRGRSTGRSTGRRYVTTYRCTHEDYPCCGCGS